MDSTLKRTWASIDLDALAYNCRHLQERMGPGARMLGVVKADAYGHGAVQSARVLEEMGCAYLAVSNIDEARELRLGGVGLPVLQLGATPADQSAAILANGVTQAVYSERSAQGFSREALKAGGTMRVHIKLDTGMSRLGFQCDEAHFEDSLEAIDRVCGLPGLEVEGIFTHFAVSDETGASSRAYTHVAHSSSTSGSRGCSAVWRSGAVLSPSATAPTAGPRPTIPSSPATCSGRVCSPTARGRRRSGWASSL